MSHAVIFNGNVFSAVSGLTILSVDAYTPPRRSPVVNDLTQSDRSKLAAAFYKEKDITVRIGLQGTSRSNVESRWDSFLALIQGLEKDLIVNQSGATRRYTATLTDTVMRLGGGAYIHAELVFTCSDRFGYDVAQTLLLQVSGFTSGVKTDSFTVGGSAPWQVPSIILTLSAVSGATLKALTIGNPTTGQIVSIVRTWTAGDVLEIDCYAKTVKVNGAEVEFTGSIPEWAPGTGYLTYADGFTSRTFSNTVRYYKRYV